MAVQRRLREEGSVPLHCRQALEEELKVQFAFEESLVEYYEILQQDAFESSKPGRTQRLDSRVQAGLLPLAQTLAK